MWLFFIAYFYLLRHPSRPVFRMPLTALDRALPFQPSAFAAYVSLWFYVGIAPGLMPTLRELLRYLGWIAALCLAGLACFYFFPTAVPPYDFDAAHGSAIAMLKGVDAAGNACPSLHVATALFSAIWIRRLLGTVGVPAPLHWLNWGWFVAIAYSTLAIKQHVVYDVAGGTLLALLFAWPALRGARGSGR
ncbi:MAG: phosphatase PAP2 family protein [Burkholderiales bacterium]|nr:phosphatase PAP2 family protein [Burkholderiales bacterium]MDE1928694.1 phosphatase PAP2 family protein [Burkholderiales bacterium]MDE2160892.1 phosphatase PAP2 family protein [Burkholderiales bacterium]MDE2504019.1 phosphatase PAP2 family protein [Burkholderiales bacterium]